MSWRSYSADDECTFYFIIISDKYSDEKHVQAYTDNKELAKAYMDFHKCKQFKIKTVKDTYRNIVEIINENLNDEIALYHMNIKSDPDHKLGEETKLVAVPITLTERDLVSEEADSFLASRVNYSLINDLMYYLKPKYQNILKDIFMTDIVMKTCYNKDSYFTLNAGIDEVRVLYRSVPDHFGQ